MHQHQFNKNIFLFTFVLLTSLGFAQTNLAKGKPATQSTTCNSGSASRAVDGNTDGKYASNSTTHTCSNKKNPWWEVDLKKLYQVEKVIIWNRVEAPQRLSNYKVELLDQNRQVVRNNLHGTQAGYPTSSILGAAGRYVRITLLTSTNPLSLAEVQVISQNLETINHPANDKIAVNFNNITYTNGGQYFPVLPPLSDMNEGHEFTFICANGSDIFFQLNPTDVQTGKERFIGWDTRGFAGNKDFMNGVSDLWIWGVTQIIALPSQKRWVVIGNGWDWL